MAYTYDMEDAAKRHYDDGCTLAGGLRHDNAGYHFGLSVECVIKQVLSRTYGLRPSDRAWWAHFPELRNVAELFVSTRANATLRRIIEDNSLMQEWDVTMRYSKNSSVPTSRATKWKNQANSALGLLFE
ncbi:hypothetical protein [Burkholderia ambifaria]|uniref:hypothetical protein n=1 Tax=Burkholderia ambifaria TaxID=152480 RepID=UPI001C936B47|nr:hypothetical protein [Burkholderia ambifaria]MBY4771902.1 hypothetical protein [Burkholderia ambifaria]